MLDFKDKIELDIQVAKSGNMFSARTYMNNGYYLNVEYVITYQDKKLFDDGFDDTIMKTITFGDLIHCIKQSAIDEMKEILKKGLEACD